MNDTWNTEKNLWERFQQQKDEPWPFYDFDEYKEWWFVQEERMNKNYNNKDVSE